MQRSPQPTRNRNRDSKIGQFDQIETIATIEMAPGLRSGADKAKSGSAADLLNEFKSLDVDDKRKLDYCLAELEKHKNSIISLEMGECEKSMLFKGLEMKSKFETPEQTFNYVEKALFSKLGLEIGVDISVDSITRLGILSEKQAQKKQYPPIRIRFCTPRDRTEFTRQLSKLKDIEECKYWSLQNELPQILKNETSICNGVAWMYRRKNPGAKTNVRFRGKKTVVMIKNQDGAWIQMDPKTFGELKKDYIKSESDVGSKVTQRRK